MDSEHGELVTRFHRENVERLARIETTQEHTDSTLERLTERLFGNGQPGEISHIKSRVTALETERWKLVGALGVIFAVIAFLTGGGTLTLRSLLK